MFVRFREYILNKGHRSWRVEVVQSYRCEITGNPRSRTIAYLGTVREKYLHVPAFRAWYWRQVDAKLAGLQLSEQEKDNIKEAINQRIPRPIISTTRALSPPKVSHESKPSPAIEARRTATIAKTVSPEESAEELLAALMKKPDVDL